MSGFNGRAAARKRGRPKGSKGKYLPAQGRGGMNLPRPAGGHDLKRLREIHHLILRIAAASPTMTHQEIADLLGVTKAMVGYTINCELGQQKLAVLRGEADNSVIDILEEYNELAPIAVEVMENVMLDSTAKHSDKLRAAENILGGAGYGKRERLDIFQHQITDADIEEARRRSREKGRQAGIVIEDAEVISESESES